MGGNPSREVGEGTHRGAQHHAIRALDRLAGVQFHPVGDTQFHYPVQRRLSPSIDHDFGGDVAALLGDAGDR